MKQIHIIKNVPNVPDNYPNMIFGQQLNYRRALTDYINGAEKIFLSQKRQSYKKAIKDFVSLHKPKNYYIPGFYSDDSQYDDSFLVYYTK